MGRYFCGCAMELPKRGIWKNSSSISRQPPNNPVQTFKLATQANVCSLTTLMNAPPASPVTEDDLPCCYARAQSLLTLGVGVSLVLCDGNRQTSIVCYGCRSRTGDHFCHRACLVATCAHTRCFVKDVKPSQTLRRKQVLQYI